ncbi:c-type cytochrome [Bryobacter aggregatus]|uniref:c-type cytochrome n=1 Tax=Bryobacter aggregatus TaxID=360054 RepID=UPI0004E147A0|nr:cytochrome c [Bryobacter aggregatus]
MTPSITLSFFLAALALQAAVPQYSTDIAPLLNQHCVSCHRPGEIGPMPLRSYAEVRPWAKALAASVAQRKMPPWDADPKVGKFHNDRRLPQADIDRILAWAKNGAPEGDPKRTPPTPTFAEGWVIPQPDLVVRLPEERVISPTGPDEYVKITVDPGIKSDLWVKAVELRPGNRRVVHHAHVFLITPNPAPSTGPRAPSPFVKEDGLQVIRPGAPVIDDGCSHPDGGYIIGRPHGETRTLLASFVPGMSPDQWPLHVAKKIPAGSKFLFDIHYSKVTGKEERDRSMVGLSYAPGPPKVEIERFEASNFYFEIPPGAENHRVTACVTASKDIEVLSLLGHMHYRGKAFQIDARLPDGSSQMLLNVPHYNFDWQEMYRLEAPIRLPKGSVIRIVSWFDNSANNRANPDPAKTVRWGEHTRTEMMDGWVEFVEAGKLP